MRYISTRGGSAPVDFANATLAGLAPDGGLYVPESWPKLDPDALRELRGRPYEDVAFAVMRPYVAGSLDDDELKELIAKAYCRFHHAAIAPLVQLDARRWLLELFHGPTLAFKDFALQFLGHVFEHLLERQNRSLTIVGATSGDTGSAAIDAVACRDNIEIFMLHPKGRVSEVQRRQMTTVMAPNVHNIAIEGSFDDCQAMVKDLFADQVLREELSLSAVNSINWTRVMAQIVYYFYAALRLGAPGREMIFSVPTGNFGDVFAGYVAKQMGLPINTLIVATNVNDIMTRALSTGDYSVGQVQPTISPSMDIQVASNFERLLFDLYGRDGDAVRNMMDRFKQSRALEIPADKLARIKQIFSAYRVDENETAMAIRRIYTDCGQLIDPHTAVGIFAAGHVQEGTTPIITLATAHPAKFREAVERASGQRPQMPARIGDLFDRAERYEKLPHNLDTLKRYIRETVGR